MTVDTLLKKDKEGTLFKTACLKAMTEELMKLGQPVSSTEAEGALKRLNKLDEAKPSGGELARGAIAGTGLSVAGNLLGSTISGTRAPLRAAVAGAPTLGKQIAGAAIPGVIVGAALPLVRRHMDVEAEKEKLRSHLGISNHGAVRSQIKQTLGVG